MAKSKKSAFVRKGEKNTKREPFRDIEKDGVTYTFLSQFLQCRESARLAYVEGLTQDGVIPPLEFGQLFHLGFELLCNGQPATNITKATKAYVDRKLKEKLPPAQVNEIKKLQAIVNVMFPQYADWYNRPQSKGNREPYGIEFRSTTENVAQELPFGELHTLPVSGRTIRLYGRFDGILRCNGGLWLMENKTKSQIDEDGLTAYLPFDLQTMIYSHAISLKYGEPCKGIIYNVVKRPGLRWNQEKETLEEHVQRVAEAVEKEPASYFMRWHVELGPTDVEKYVSETLNPILEQVLTWWDSIKGDPFRPFKTAGAPNPHHFVNPEGLYTKFGKSQFFELLTRNSMYGLKRREKDANSKTPARPRGKAQQKPKVRKQPRRR